MGLSRTQGYCAEERPAVTTWAPHNFHTHAGACNSSTHAAQSSHLALASHEVIAPGWSKGEIRQRIVIRFGPGVLPPGKLHSVFSIDAVDAFASAGKESALERQGRGLGHQNTPICQPRCLTHPVHVLHDPTYSQRVCLDLRCGHAMVGQWLGRPGVRPQDGLAAEHSERVCFHVGKFGSRKRPLLHRVSSPFPATPRRL